MKVSKTEAQRLLNEARRAMNNAETPERCKNRKERACYINSTLYPKQCAERDCRYCYLEREMQYRLAQLYDRKVSVTINGDVTITVTR